MRKDWWKESVVYQIYPKSFCDSNGDGIGDIKGIISKLDYLKELGVEVIWSTPIYVSPMKDNGYDIADYYNIDPSFGTMEDFEELLKEIHKRGMKLIMDMVINHTSTEHFWFKEALKDEKNKYHNYYIWKKGKDGKEPNNWKSKFGGSAWKYVEHLDKYYLHLFDVTQADLNWENEELREDLYKMIRFWLDKGIDGFRLDVINLISKDQRFLDDFGVTATSDGRKFYTDGPRVHEYLKELAKETFNRYEGSLTVGEMSSTTIDNCIKYTNPESKELTMAFNFHHLKVDYPNGEKWALGELDFFMLKDIFNTWQKEMEKGDGWSAVFWCNHDQPRVITRFGNTKKYYKESGKMLATVIHLLRGTPYIYQGEEFGMTNPNFDTIEKYRDVESINAFKILKELGKSEKEIYAILAQKSRDNSRTPVQWSDEKNAGFTSGTPWIDVAENYKEINVKKSLEDKESIFYHYKKLIDIRKNYDVISRGSYNLCYEDNENIYAYTRENEKEIVLVLNNFFEKECEVNILDRLKDKKGEILISNYNELKLKNGKIKLRPYESVAIMYEK